VPRRIDLGAALAALAGLLLLISLFLDWYAGVTAWTVFEALDIVLLVLAAGAIAAAVRPDLVDRPVLLALGAAALLVVAVQVIDPPPAVADVDDRDVGAWLALFAAVLLVAGAIVRSARIAITLEPRSGDARPRVEAVDRRPAASGDPGAPSPGLFSDPERTQPISTQEPPDRP